MKPLFARAVLAAIVLGISGYVVAQVGFPPAPPKVSPAAGVIDMHVHPDPDVFGRALTDVELATVARRKGMRGIVLSTDLGQQGMMTPPDGIENEYAAVKAAGVSQADLDKMLKTNPAKLLGI